MTIKGICKDCKKEKNLTKHSLIGGHLPPYVYLCFKCHQVRHGVIRFKKKYNRKLQPHTKNKKRIKQL